MESSSAVPSEPRKEPLRRGACTVRDRSRPTPELAAELGDAITSALAAEKKSARLLREGLEMK